MHATQCPHLWVNGTMTKSFDLISFTSLLTSSTTPIAAWTINEPLSRSATSLNHHKSEPQITRIIAWFLHQSGASQLLLLYQVLQKLLLSYLYPFISSTHIIRLNEKSSQQNYWKKMLLFKKMYSIHYFITSLTSPIGH